MGFGQDEGQARAAREEAIKALKATMRPEFINRVDEIIVFNELSREDIDRIAELMIHQVSERLARARHRAGAVGRGGCTCWPRKAMTGSMARARCAARYSAQSRMR